MVNNLGGKKWVDKNGFLLLKNKFSSHYHTFCLWGLKFCIKSLCCGVDCVDQPVTLSVPTQVEIELGCDNLVIGLGLTLALAKRNTNL